MVTRLNDTCLAAIDGPFYCGWSTREKRYYCQRQRPNAVVLLLHWCVGVESMPMPVSSVRVCNVLCGTRIFRRNIILTSFSFAATQLRSDRDLPLFFLVGVGGLFVLTPTLD